MGTVLPVKGLGSRSESCVIPDVLYGRGYWPEAGLEPAASHLFGMDSTN